jgi:hypothetical protein
MKRFGIAAIRRTSVCLINCMGCVVMPLMWRRIALIVPDVATNVPVQQHGVRHAEHPLDVICICKRHVGDSNMAQHPQLVIPFARLTGFCTVPTCIRPMYMANDKMCRDWLDLAKYVCALPDSDTNQETAEYLLELSLNQLSPRAAPPLNFHSTFPTSSADELANLISAPRFVFDKLALWHLLGKFLSTFVETNHPANTM